jgi:sphingomyelin phosphodiesterase
MPQHKEYPASLTGPKTIPVQNHDPHPLPPKASDSLLLESAFEQVVSINANPLFGAYAVIDYGASLT